MLIGEGMNHIVQLPHSKIYRAKSFLKTKIAKKIRIESNSDFLKESLTLWLSNGIQAVIHKKIFIDDESDSYDEYDHLTNTMAEIYFLLSSIVIYQKQSNRIEKPNITLGLNGGFSSVSYYNYDPREERIEKGGFLNGTIGSLIIDNRWYLWQKNNFFNKLNKILINSQFKQNFRNRIYNALVLVGKGQITTERDMAFLYNMIAIETILCQRGDHYSTVLSERLKALYSGINNSNETFSAEIKILYDKRCKYVHDGDKNEITWQDVNKTEKIIFNLMNTVAQKPELFRIPKTIDDWVTIQKASEIEGKEYLKNRGIRFMP